MKCQPWIRHFPPKFQCFSSQCALHGLRVLEITPPFMCPLWAAAQEVERLREGLNIVDKKGTSDRFKAILEILGILEILLMRRPGASEDRRRVRQGPRSIGNHSRWGCCSDSGFRDRGPLNGWRFFLSPYFQMINDLSDIGSFLSPFFPRCVLFGKWFVSQTAKGGVTYTLWHILLLTKIILKSLFMQKLRISRVIPWKSLCFPMLIRLPLPQCFCPRGRKLRPWYEKNWPPQTLYLLGKVVWVSGVFGVGVDKGALSFLEISRARNPLKLRKVTFTELFS